MKSNQSQMKPQDIVVLLKIVALDSNLWLQKPLADSLGMSQSEVSQSVARSLNSGLLMGNGKQVRKTALLEFLQYGISYVFPQHPGAMVRGVVTAHSAAPLNAVIVSEEQYVWPYSRGDVRGQGILPLYPTVPEAALKDPLFHELLALVDALRVGKARERALAIEELSKRLQ